MLPSGEPAERKFTRISTIIFVLAKLQRKMMYIKKNPRNKAKDPRNAHKFKRVKPERKNRNAQRSEHLKGYKNVMSGNIAM